MGWDVFQILFLYWLESGISGFINIFKIFLAQGTINESGESKPLPLMSPGIGKYFYSLFFLTHFSIFMVVHYSFLIALFKPKNSFPINSYVIQAILFLLVSHLISFFMNYIGKGEYKNTIISKQMKATYSRIIIMQFVIISSGFVVSFFGSMRILVFILVLLKICFDLSAHLKEHTININFLRKGDQATFSPQNL